MSETWQLIDFIKWGEQYFTEREFENPKGEIEWFLCSLLKCNRLDIYLRYDDANMKYLYMCTVCNTSWKTAENV